MDLTLKRVPSLAGFDEAPFTKLVHTQNWSTHTSLQDMDLRSFSDVICGGVGEGERENSIRSVEQQARSA